MSTRTARYRAMARDAHAAAKASKDREAKRQLNKLARTYERIAAFCESEHAELADTLMLYSKARESATLSLDLGASEQGGESSQI